MWHQKLFQISLAPIFLLLITTFFLVFVSVCLASLSLSLCLVNSFLFYSGYAYHILIGSSYHISWLLGLLIRLDGTQLFEVTSDSLMQMWRTKALLIKVPNCHSLANLLAHIKATLQIYFLHFFSMRYATIYMRPAAGVSIIILKHSGKSSSKLLFWVCKQTVAYKLWVCAVRNCWKNNVLKIRLLLFFAKFQFVPCMLTKVQLYGKICLKGQFYSDQLIFWLVDYLMFLHKLFVSCAASRVQSNHLHCLLIDLFSSSLFGWKKMMYAV